MNAFPTVSPEASHEAPFLKYLCRACGLVYDEALGDPDSGLPPGTRFADIPDDWACPLCQVTKADFELYVSSSECEFARRAEAVPRTPLRADPGIVIVGGGQAGWAMAEAVRQRDAAVSITLVSACAADRYDKPVLSVALAKGVGLEGLVLERGADAARRLGVRLMAHTHAVRIGSRARQLTTTRGTLAYSELVLAHGAQVALPPPLSAEHCWRINHLDAYVRFRAALDSASAPGPRQVAVVGAGLVGCELANDLALAGHQVTLIDTHDQPLARWADQGAGAQMLVAWRDLPITFLAQTRVAALGSQGGHKVLTLDDGRVVVVDHVVAATGLASPHRLAASAGLQWREGIAVDPQTLATSDLRIHALGDCITLGGQACRYIEPIARQAATIAAKFLARRQGADLEACPLPYEPRAALVRVKTSSCPMTLH